MALRLIEWFLTNKYVHMQSFLLPPLRDEAVPAALRERLTGRLRQAVRVAKIRILLFAILYVSVLGAILIAILEWVAARLDSEAVDLGGQAVVWLLALLPSLGLLAGIGVVLLNRALGLLEADIYTLGMEAVSRVVHKGGAALPSTLRVQRHPGS